MNCVLGNVQDKLAEEDVDRLFNGFESSPPAAFKDFYLSNNGGDIFDSANENVFLLGGFIPITHGALPIERVYRDLVESFPELNRFLPFAYDKGGDCFLMSIADSECKIYLWLMDETELVFVEDSFESFLNRLFP